MVNTLNRPVICSRNLVATFQTNLRIPSDRVLCSGVLVGEIMLQSLASFTAALVLSPAPGSSVLDMCAAPGGKTTALAQIMGDSGEIIALDRSHSKV